MLPLRFELTLCPFCLIEPGAIVLKNETAIAFRDRFPVAEGHTLVTPRRHVASIYQLPESDQAGIWDLVRAVREDLSSTHRPDGFTIGINDGPAAGQTVPHGHVHVIPRRAGDVTDPRGGIRWINPSAARYW